MPNRPAETSSNDGSAGRWCPSCGDEYRPDIEQCVDCFIDLVDEEPAVLNPVSHATDLKFVDEPFVLDLASLTEEQTAVLLEHIEVTPVPVRLVGEGLIQAEDGYEEELEVAVARVLNGGPARRMRPNVAMVGTSLSLTRRWLAFAIDSVLIGAVVVMADQLLDGGIVSLIAIAFSVLNQVIGVKERGRSVGKMLVGGVVRTYEGEKLSWSAAGSRWLVKDGPSVVPVILWWVFEGGRSVWVVGQLVAAVYFWALVASIVRDLQHRGFHDVVIGSAVMSADSISPQMPDVPGASQR